MAGDLPTKACAVCGRTITWRRKWSRAWEQVRYCSDRCRARGSGGAAGRDDRGLDDRLEAALAAAPRGRVLALADVDLRGPDGAEPGREEVRSSARRLVARGSAEIVQGGRVVDPSTARGDLGIRRR